MSHSGILTGREPYYEPHHENSKRFKKSYGKDHLFPLEDARKLTHPPENCQCYTFKCLFKGKLDYSIIRTPVNGEKEKSLKGTSLYLSFFETKDIQTPLKTVLVVRQETLIYRNSILVNSPKGLKKEKRKKVIEKDVYA